MSTRCHARTFAWFSDSRIDRPSPQSHLWLYAGTVVEGRAIARITRVAAYCETRCGHRCPSSPAPACAEYAGARTFADWYDLARAEVVSFCVVPFCEGA